MCNLYNTEFLLQITQKIAFKPQEMPNYLHKIKYSSAVIRKLFASQGVHRLIGCQVECMIAYRQQGG